MKRITNTGEAQRGVQDQGMATASFLRNRYWILRHGKSIPNEKGLIVSSIVCDYGPFSSLSTHLFYSLLVVWIVRKWRFTGFLSDFNMFVENFSQIPKFLLLF